MFCGNAIGYFIPPAIVGNDEVYIFVFFKFFFYKNKIPKLL